MKRQAWFHDVKIALLVLLCIGVFILILGRNRYYSMIVNHAKESVLKRDLLTMREAIHNYMRDRQRPPESLQTLVDQKYLRMIPENPITQKADWVPHYVNFDLGDGKSLICIDDVHASTGPTDRKGIRYSDW